MQAIPEQPLRRLPSEGTNNQISNQAPRLNDVISTDQIQLLQHMYIHVYIQLEGFSWM